MISGLMRMWLHDLSGHLPTGHNDLWASENVTVCNSELPPMKLPLMICSPAIWTDRPNSPNNSDSPTMFGFLTLAHEHKFPNSPEIGPAFSSMFMFVLVKTFVFATCLYHGDVFWHLISIWIYEKPLFYCSGTLKKCMLKPSQKRNVFWGCSTCIFLKSHCSKTMVFHRSQWKWGAKRHHHDINMWQIPREATAPAVLFHHFNLRTVFAVMNIAWSVLTEVNQKCRM